MKAKNTKAYDSIEYNQNAVTENMTIMLLIRYTIHMSIPLRQLYLSYCTPSLLIYAMGSASMSVYIYDMNLIEFYLIVHVTALDQNGPYVMSISNIHHN